ncbi:MAG: hypothetical protein AAGH42_09615 [Pseudomonadota bacterium]
MISVPYFLQQLRGFWGMAFNQPDWRGRIGLGPEDVVASFYTLLPTMAVIVVGALIEPRLINTVISDPALTEAVDAYGLGTWQPAPMAARLLIAILAFGITWSLTLGMLIRISRRLEGEVAMGTMIIGYNWLQFYMRALAVLPLIVFLLTDSAKIMSFLALPCFALSISLLWGMLRRALPQTEWTVIVGIIICMGIVILIASFLAAMIGALFYTPTPRAV